MISKEEFLKECKTVRVVNTFEGDALLIGNEVIRLHGTFADRAELIAMALRGEELPARTVPTRPTHGKMEWRA